MYAGAWRSQSLRGTWGVATRAECATFIVATVPGMSGELVAYGFDVATQE